MFLAIMTLLSEKNSFDGLFSGSGKVVGIGNYHQRRYLC